jgi:hypothetical protein
MDMNAFFAGFQSYLNQDDPYPSNPYSSGTDVKDWCVGRERAKRIYVEGSACGIDVMRGGPTLPNPYQVSFEVRMWDEGFKWGMNFEYRYGV